MAVAEGCLYIAFQFIVIILTWRWILFDGVKLRPRKNHMKILINLIPFSARQREIEWKMKPNYYLTISLLYDFNYPLSTPDIFGK